MWPLLEMNSLTPWWRRTLSTNTLDKLMCSFVIQATSDSKHRTKDEQICFSSHITCWVYSSPTQMAGLIAQDIHHEKKKYIYTYINQIFTSFPAVHILHSSSKNWWYIRWHCTTTPAVPRIMSICVKGKAHTKIRSKVCTLKASNSGQKSCSSTDSAVPNQLLRCHTAA